MLKICCLYIFSFHTYNKWSFPLKIKWQQVSLILQNTFLYLIWFYYCCCLDDFDFFLDFQFFQWLCKPLWETIPGMPIVMCITIITSYFVIFQFSFITGYFSRFSLFSTLCSAKTPTLNNKFSFCFSHELYLTFMSVLHEFQNTRCFFIHEDILLFVHILLALVKY